jgi:transcriptional regulator with XRE-family HTH domain
MAKRKRTELSDEGVKIRSIGQAIGGEHWQAEVARAIGYSKSMVTKVLSGERAADAVFLRNLRREGINKVEKLNEALGSDALPLNKSPKTKQARAMIKEAIKLMREDLKDVEV